MSLKLIRDRAKKLEKPNSAPDWVSGKNRTSEIYACMRDLENEKLIFLLSRKNEVPFFPSSTYSYT